MKRCVVSVEPAARETAVEQTGPGDFVVRVTAPATGGAANRAMLRALADYLGLAPSRLRILRGAKAARKIVEIV